MSDELWFFRLRNVGAETVFDYAKEYEKAHEPDCKSPEVMADIVFRDHQRAKRLFTRRRLNR